MTKSLEVAAAVGAVLAALLAGVPLVEKLVKRRDVPPPSDWEQLVKAADRLARLLHGRLRTEAAKRGFVEADMARVVWGSTAARPNGMANRLPGSVPDNPTYVERIVRNFTAVPSRRLIVVGEPGSGKTVHLLLLAWGLLDRYVHPERAAGASSGQQVTVTDPEPVPILLPADRWNPLIDDFDKWAAERLRHSYEFLDGAEFGNTAVADLLKDGRVMVILDGLDEMEESLRGLALSKLTSPEVESWPVVISCSAAGFTSLPPDDARAFLYRARVTTLQSLSTTAAVKYLRGDQTQHSAQWWRPVRQALQLGAPAGLVAALRLPLYAALTRSAYGPGRRDPAALVHVAATADVQDHLLKSFLHDAFSTDGHSGHSWARDSALRWLNWFARQPDQRLSWWRWHNMIGLQAGAIFSGISAATIYALTSGFPNGLARGVPVGMTLGLIVGVLRRQPHQAKRGLAAGGAAALGIGLARICLDGDVVKGLHDGVEMGLPLGVGFALMPWMRGSATRIAAGSALAGVAAGCWAGTWDGIALGLADGLHRLLSTSLGEAFAVAFTSVLVRITGSLDEAGQPTGLNAALRRRWPDLAAHLAIGTAAGIAIGVCGGIVIVLRASLAHHGGQGLHRAVAVALTYGVTAALAIGVTGAFLRWISQPSARIRVATPATTLASARAISLTYIGVATALGALVMQTIHWVSAGLGPGYGSDVANLAHIEQGAALGLTIGLVLAASFTPWPTFVVVRVTLWLSRRAPLRLMTFLEDAHDAEVLRCEGAHYAFRHAKIRACLATM
ncbi:hypothetical protein ABZT06_47230 [Streptomyces sp. NPDC005483]|uniref:hypothetical protein n=1 Tax=Streptomyces sp. NPDC005483 TaxID=3154882 RepID=UPI0033BD8E1B